MIVLTQTSYLIRNSLDNSHKSNNHTRLRTRLHLCKRFFIIFSQLRFSYDRNVYFIIFSLVSDFLFVLIYLSA
jgi:hypothetical protein